MAPTPPSSFTWTLRFKYHKSTTVLHVDPLQSFDSIKAELLRALDQTHPDGRLYGQSIPKNPRDVILARPNDIHDHSQGWSRLEEEDGGDLLKEENDAKPTKKRKSGAGSPSSSPKAAGMKEGAALAYKFRTDEDEGLGLEDETWDVVIPSYEDVTGTLNEGDVGGIQNGLD